MSKETWAPRCPKCHDGNVILAPANQITKHALAFVEVYCPHCSWLGRLDENIKRIYVRL